MGRGAKISPVIGSGVQTVSVGNTGKPTPANTTTSVIKRFELSDGEAPNVNGIYTQRSVGSNIYDGPSGWYFDDGYLYDSGDDLYYICDGWPTNVTQWRGIVAGAELIAPYGEWL
jgi:hypothetical protein